MVWQENVSCIVMLTKTFDFTKVMCVQYWPASKEKDECYGELPEYQINIGVVKEEELANFHIRTFRLYKMHNNVCKNNFIFIFTLSSLCVFYFHFFFVVIHSLLFIFNDIILDATGNYLSHEISLKFNSFSLCHFSIIHSFISHSSGKNRGKNIAAISLYSMVISLMSFLKCNT